MFEFRQRAQSTLCEDVLPLSASSTVERPLRLIGLVLISSVISGYA